MLQGKVAIVTGAARGLGRVEALELASHGAAVVVNDLGTASDGSGHDPGPAEAVVNEIEAAGGRAVAHFGDVADWDTAEGLIQAAVDAFGQLDILVNNAGFCRDRMIFNMSEEEFDSVIRVHVKGHFSTMRHAAVYWRNRAKAEGGQTYGRLISTGSEAFLFGSIGQPNYAAAKAGIVAMTMSTAQAMLKYGVTANVICPRARTRMNDSGPLAAMFAKPEDGFDVFAPENVGPIVAYLASPEAENISGEVFIPWGKQVQVVGRPDVTNPESLFMSEERWTTESLHEALGAFFEKRQPVLDGFSVPGS
jgi:3-oxoacyl-[acyl-carrier protein] reductase